MGSRSGLGGRGPGGAVFLVSPPQGQIRSRSHGCERGDPERTTCLVSAQRPQLQSCSGGPSARQGPSGPASGHCNPEQACACPQEDVASGHQATCSGLRPRGSQVGPAPPPSVFLPGLCPDPSERPAPPSSPGTRPSLRSAVVGVSMVSPKTQQSAGQPTEGSSTCQYCHAQRSELARWFWEALASHCGQPSPRGPLGGHLFPIMWGG